MSTRAKKFSKDLVLFGLATFLPKLLGFLLVPLYTSTLSTDAYGTAELLTTICSLMLPILMLDISDAILLFTTERRKHGEDTLVPLLYGHRLLLRSSGVVFCVCLVIALVFRTADVAGQCAFVAIYYFLQAMYLNLLAYLRGMDDAASIVWASILNSIVTIVSNILLILVLRWGLWGLLVSNCVGVLVCDIYVLVKRGVFGVFRNGAKVTSDERRAMLRLCVPLIFVGIAWWVNSSADRIMLSVLVGVGANGIYAVAAKIPSILTAVQTVFYQAMQLSVFSEIDSDDRNAYLERMYKYYAFAMVLACCLLILLNKPLASILFLGDFSSAWKYVPGLLLSIVMFSITGYITTIATAIKETRIIAWATSIGALANIILNFVLIGPLEIYGAVIATMAGYFIIWLIVVIFAQRHLGASFKIGKSVLMFALLLLQCFFEVYLDGFYVGQVIVLAVLVIMNVSAIREMASLFSQLVKQKLA